MRCYVVGAGDLGTEAFSPRPADLVIAADGGQVHLQRLGIHPDVLLGDWDSSSVPPSGAMTFPVEKDDTDMRLAVLCGWERGAREFHLLGGIGGRPDHTLANYQLLAELAERGGIGFLYHNDYLIAALHRRRITFSAGCRGTLSVFAHTDRAVVSESGLQYTVDCAVLCNTHPLGVSNAFSGKEAVVEVTEGIALVMWQTNGEGTFRL